MKLLLDSHALMWAAFAPERLSPAAIAAILAGGNTTSVSAISPYELEFKKSIGKLSFPLVSNWEAALSGLGLCMLPISVAHGVAAARLPLHHRDPWDRLLVAQAASEGMVLVSSDRSLQPYGVATLW